MISNGLKTLKYIVVELFVIIFYAIMCNPLKSGLFFLSNNKNRVSQKYHHGQLSQRVAAQASSSVGFIGKTIDNPKIEI